MEGELMPDTEVQNGEVIDVDVEPIVSVSKEHLPQLNKEAHKFLQNESTKFQEAKNNILTIRDGLYSDAELEYQEIVDSPTIPLESKKLASMIFAQKKKEAFENSIREIQIAEDNFHDRHTKAIELLKKLNKIS